MSKQFGFDAIMGPESDQNDVYNAVGVPEMVARVLQGYNCTIFAFGQTGSGKTHTMEGRRGASGDLLEPGIIPRAVFDLFSAAQRAASDEPRHISMAVSFTQIYMEQCYDLIGPSANIWGDVSTLFQPPACSPDSRHPRTRVRGVVVARRLATAPHGEMQEGCHAKPRLSMFLAQEASRTTREDADNMRPRPGLRLRWDKGRGFYLENSYRVEVSTPQGASLYFIRRSLLGPRPRSHRDLVHTKNLSGRFSPSSLQPPCSPRYLRSPWSARSPDALCVLSVLTVLSRLHLLAHHHLRSTLHALFCHPPPQRPLRSSTRGSTTG